MPTGTMRRLFAESSSGGGGGGGRGVEPSAAVLCAPRPRRAHAQPCSADFILGPPAFLLSPGGSSREVRDGKHAGGREDEGGDVGWTVLGGSPPARAGNPLVNDPHFLLNQRRPVVPPPDLSIFDYHGLGGGNHGHLPTYRNSLTTTTAAASFAPSYSPAVRVQGFDVASCRSSHHSNRVLSARA